jgi:hypothetical protein
VALSHSEAKKPQQIPTQPSNPTKSTSCLRQPPILLLIQEMGMLKNHWIFFISNKWHPTHNHSSNPWTFLVPKGQKPRVVHLDVNGISLDISEEAKNQNRTPTLWFSQDVLKSRLESSCSNRKILSTHFT